VSGDSRGQPDHQRGDDHHGPVVDRPLLVPGGDPAPLLEPVHAPLHHVASPVGVRIEARLATWAPRAPLSLVAPLGDRVRDAAFSQHPPAARGGVALVGDQPSPDACVASRRPDAPPGWRRARPRVACSRVAGPESRPPRVGAPSRRRPDAPSCSTLPGCAQVPRPWGALPPFCVFASRPAAGTGRVLGRCR
jgi:hypothetical protein